MATAAIVTRPTFILADRLKIQNQRIREKDFIVLGRLTAVLFEAQRDTRGLSASRPRYSNAAQPVMVPDAMKPFSEKQTVLWQSTTLDWLSGRNAPLIARSKDKKDILLPAGITPLPDIPDPRWVPQHALSVCPRGATGCSKCIAPRIRQRLIGCPIVGDRVRDKITSRDGHTFGVLHPILTLSIIVNGPEGAGHFASIRCGVDQADGTHMAMLIDDENHAYFVGGTFA